MPLDGVYLRHLKKEIEKVLGSRVDKICQPNREEILLHFRTVIKQPKSDEKNLDFAVERKKNLVYKLLFSVRANSARVHFTNYSIENPKTPPMFCMLLRKRLLGAKLISIDQPGLERILFFNFEARNELGDIVKLKVIVEIMGKHSNFILTDDRGLIIDSIKRVDASMSSLRMILPGLLYCLPSNQNKICLLDCDIKSLVEKINCEERSVVLSKKLLGVLQGFSLSICEEIEFYYRMGEERCELPLNREMASKIAANEKLEGVFCELYELILNFRGLPWLILRQNGEFLDFSYLKMQRYENTVLLKEESSFSDLLDKFFYENDKIQRIRAKAQNLLQVLARVEKRLKRKIDVQINELAECEKKDVWKLYADLINANIAKIDSLNLKHSNNESIQLPNLYDAEMRDIAVNIDPRLSASKNAQIYYKKYKKAKIAENILNNQINLAKQDLVYINTVLDFINRAESEQDLLEIKNELMEYGFIKKVALKKSPKRADFLKFTSKNGFLILVGKNNKQNDELTLKKARNYDLWFHVKDTPGSHTVLFTEGKPVPDEDIVQAAKLAALHSKAKNSSNVPVDYTSIRNVSKPNGAKLGMVIYEKNKTIYVTPNDVMV
ncbi:MAG: NFACT family protein [Oscillospiraceae bacterium]|nr:NFACT family protein [Oscillospiraceae bacterium]